MKRRILTFFLCLLLLGGAGAAYAAAAPAAGSAADPLVSLSYLNNALLPQIRAVLNATATSTLDIWRASAAEEGGLGTELRTLSAGESVVLMAGQQFTLLSGTAEVTVETGELIDAAAGASRGNGPARLYARCIVCEDSRVYLDVSAESVLKLSAGGESADGSPFRDVARSDWFYGDVNAAYERGLVNGMDGVHYAPAGTLTGAECVKLAACMYQLRQMGTILLKNSTDGGPWYRSYVNYALANRILDTELADYDSPITRGKFLRIFYHALPNAPYTEINVIPDGVIPDVAVMDSIGAQVYAFYRAGILTGYTGTPGFAEHAFGPETTVSRAEVAAIMNRMFDETARVRFEL